MTARIPAKSGALSDEQMRRYSRQLLLREVGGRGQGRILAASATLVCRSGVGEVASEYLSRAGVGRLILHTPDTHAAGAPAELSKWVQTVPAASIGRWDGDAVPERLFWVVSGADGVHFGCDEAGLLRHAAVGQRGLVESDANAVLAGSALALGMLQGLLGLALPSDCLLGS